MSDSCETKRSKEWKHGLSKHQRKYSYKGYDTEPTPVLQIMTERPQLTGEAEEYLSHIGKSYDQWVMEDATEKINTDLNAVTDELIKSYENEDLRFHWLKERVISYFNIQNPQAFLELAERSNKKYLKQIMKFICGPIKQKNMHKYLWFYTTISETTNQTLIHVSWKKEIVDAVSDEYQPRESTLVKAGRGVLAKRLHSKKVDGSKQSIKEEVFTAEIPVKYKEKSSTIYVQYARRPKGTFHKVNFLEFSRIPITKYIPEFQKLEMCNEQMPTYVCEVKIGRISKPDGSVFISQCLEERPRILKLDGLLSAQLSDEFIKTSLKVDFRFQWLKEKVLNFFEISDPREFYKMCCRHNGLHRNHIIDFINCKYDQMDEDSNKLILFFYTTQYQRNYYKFVKFSFKKEELEPVVEEPVTDNQLDPTRSSVTRSSKTQEKKKRKRGLRKRHMRIVIKRHDAAIPVRFAKNVSQIHLHYGLLPPVMKNWKETKFLCILRKNNPYQYIPHFDTYEEAFAQMPKYVLVKNFEMKTLLDRLYSIVELGNNFMDKQMGEPIFPTIIDSTDGAAIILPSALVKNDNIVDHDFGKVHFPWKFSATGPIMYKKFLYEQHSMTDLDNSSVTMEVIERNLFGENKELDKQGLKKSTTRNIVAAPAGLDIHIKRLSGEEDSVLDELEELEIKDSFMYTMELFKKATSVIPHGFVGLQWLNAIRHSFRTVNANQHSLPNYLTRLDRALKLQSVASNRTHIPNIMYLFNRKIKFIKLKYIPNNVKLVSEIHTSSKDEEKEMISKNIAKKQKPTMSSLKNKKINDFKSFSRVPQEFLSKIINHQLGQNLRAVCFDIFLMKISKNHRLRYSQIKDNLVRVKKETKRSHKHLEYPLMICVPHWRHTLSAFIKKYEGFQEAIKKIFKQKDYVKRDSEFKNTFFQYLRKLFWFCKEKLPVNYGPFTLYRYWKERELITYPFIKQCLGSRTIKFMLTNCYYNDKYYYEQFSKQFPGLIKVHKRAKCYSHMIMGFLLEIKLFQKCNSIDSLSSVIVSFWGYLRNHWATSHFLSYQKIFCWALSFVEKTLLGKVKKKLNLERLMSLPHKESRKELIRAVCLMTLWRDEFDKYFSLCIDDKGGYHQPLVLFEDTIFAGTKNVSKICCDLLQIFKHLWYLTNVFSDALASCITEPYKVTYWKEQCLSSVRNITNYDIFDISNDKKWDNDQNTWHKNFRPMENESIRILNSVFENIRDPIAAIGFINSIKKQDTSKRIYSQLLSLLEKCIDRIMADMNKRFVDSMSPGNSCMDNYVNKINSFPSSGVMWMQRNICIIVDQLKSIFMGDAISEAIKRDKIIREKLAAALNECKDFAASFDLIGYCQDLYIRDFMLIRSLNIASIRFSYFSPGQTEKNCFLKNVPSVYFNKAILNGQSLVFTHPMKDPSTDENLTKSEHDLNSYISIDKQPSLVQERVMENEYVSENRKYFARLDFDKYAGEIKKIQAFKNFLSGSFHTVKKFSAVLNKKIEMNYKLLDIFLHDGKLPTSFIPIEVLQQFAYPVTMFTISKCRKFIYVDSPHGKLDIELEQPSSPKKLSNLEMHTIQAEKIIKDIMVVPDKINEVKNKRGKNDNKNLRLLPWVQYYILLDLNNYQIEELKQIIGTQSSNTNSILFHRSFFLLTLLREMFSESEVINLRSAMSSSSRISELDLIKGDTSEIDFQVMSNIFLSLDESQLEKIIDVGEAFETTFLNELSVVLKLQAITDTEMYEECSKCDWVNDTSEDSLPKIKNTSSGKTSNRSEESVKKSVSLIDYNSLPSLDYDAKAKMYAESEAYLENLNIVDENCFGHLLTLANVLVFYNNEFLSVKKYLGNNYLERPPGSNAVEPYVNFSRILQTHDSRITPIRESKEVGKDLDFLTNFMFEEQGNIIRKIFLKPEKFGLSIYGKDIYLETGETHFRTNKKGQMDPYKYPIMFDDSVRKRVCNLSDRYYMESKVVHYTEQEVQSESEHSNREEDHGVKRIYEPVTSWKSDESVPSDYFPQRWIDKYPGDDYHPYDPWSREAYQMMQLFKKGPPEEKGTVVEDIKIDEEASHQSELAKSADTQLTKEIVYEIHHNLENKNKTVFFTPVEESFCCYVLNGIVSENSNRVSTLALDGSRCPKDKSLLCDKISSSKVRNLCRIPQYYTINKCLIPYVQKVPMWVEPWGSKLKRTDSKHDVSFHSSGDPKVLPVKKMNTCKMFKRKISDCNFKTMHLSSSDRVPKWTTYWPVKPGEILPSNISPTLEMIARTRFLRSKFLVPEKRQYLHHFYKNHYYPLKTKRLKRSKVFDNFLQRWKTYDFYENEIVYRAIAENFVKQYAKYPKHSKAYLERLFVCYILMLFKKHGLNNELANILFTILDESNNDWKKNKLNKFLFGYYNSFQTNSEDKNALSNCESNLDDLYTFVKKQLNEKDSYGIEKPEDIPFYIPSKYLRFLSKNHSFPCIRTTYQTQNLDVDKECLDEIPKSSSNEETSENDIAHIISPTFIESNIENIKKSSLDQMKTSYTDKIVGDWTDTYEDALNNWNNQFNESLCEPLTLRNIERTINEILQSPDYHKRLYCSINTPAECVEPYAQHRHMIQPLVNTDEECRWKFDLSHTALTWKYLTNCIQSYDGFVKKVKNESEENVYFMRNFLKQVDLRMLTIMRSYLLFKRIPLRSKKFIENCGELFDRILHPLKEIQRSVIIPSWNVLQNCEWFIKPEYETTFQSFLNTVKNVRDCVQSKLLYLNRVFYHNFKVLNYFYHDEFPPGFVNNFRFIKHFRSYESKRIEYFFKNLSVNMDFYKKFLAYDYGNEFSQLNYESSKNCSNNELKNKIGLFSGSIKSSVPSHSLSCNFKQNISQSHVPRVIITLEYKHGDISFAEPVGRWVFELWFNFITRYSNIPRWMAGTCEDAGTAKIISKDCYQRYTMFEECMKYSEPKQAMTQGIQSIFDCMVALNTFRNRWKVFYKMWSARRRYSIKYSIVNEEFSLIKVNDILKCLIKIICILKTTTFIPLGCFKIDMSHFLNEKMIPRCTKFVSAICLGIVKRIQLFMKNFTKSINDLDEDADDFQHFLRNRDNLLKAEFFMADLNSGVVYAREAYEVLAHSGLKFSQSFLTYIRSMEASLNAFKPIYYRRLKRINTEKVIYQSHFKKFVNNFKIKCSGFAKKWWKEGPRNYNEQLDTGEKFLIWYRKGFYKLKVQQNEYALIRRKLDLQEIEDKEFEIAFEDYKNQETLYRYYRIYQDYFHKWGTYNWQTVNLREIFNNLQPMESSFKSLDPEVRKTPVGMIITEFIFNLSTTFNMILLLKDKSMKTHHWDMLKQFTEHELDVHDPDLRLQEFFDWNIWRFSEFIENLYILAVNESLILEEVTRITYASVDLKLEILPYYDDGILCGYILDSNNGTFHLIKTYLKELRKLKESPYCDRFMDSIITWEEILMYCQDILHDWLRVQRKWLYLRDLSHENDFELDLPEAVEEFNEVNKEYLKMTSILNRHRSVIFQCMKRGLIKKFSQYYATLSDCLERFINYLDGIGTPYARYYSQVSKYSTIYSKHSTLFDKMMWSIHEQSSYKKDHDTYSFDLEFSKAFIVPSEGE